MRKTSLAAGTIGVLLATALCLAGLACPALAAQTSEKETAQAPAAKKPLKLEDVVVRGDLVSEGLRYTSSTLLDNQDIMDRIYVTPLDMVKMAPGVTVSQYHQGGTASAFQMRGFTSCSHGPDAAIFLDGVPLNETDGYADTNVIMPLEIERLEIVKGPASALYGNYASAGTLSFYPYKKGDFKRLKLTYGSFNTANLSTVLALPDGKLNHVYAAEVHHTDGFQDNSNWDKQSAAARWTYTFNKSWEGTFGVRLYNSTWDAPGYIPQSVYDKRPASAVNEVNGGKKKRGEARADLGWRINDQSKVLFYTWYVQQDFNRYYQNWVSGSQAVGSNYGNERFFQREVLGAGVSYNYLGALAGRQTKLIVGLDFMDERETRQRWNLVVGSGRTRGSMYEDYDITLYTTALYGELNYQLLKPLRLVLGARYDMFSGDLDERLPSGTYDADGPQIFSPKAGLIFTAAKGWDLFANFGKGFALPRGQDLWKRSYLDPAYRTQYEVGLKAAPMSKVNFGVTLWRLDTTDDFQAKLDDPSVYENAGETRRQGVDAEVNFFPVKHLRLHLDYAYINAEYLDYNDGGVNRKGNRLASVPEHVINFEAAYEPDKGLGGRVRYRYVSDWYVNSANTVTADAFHVVDVQVSYRFNRRYRLALDVVNLFDETYSEYVGYSNNEKTYAPADPLSAYLTLSIDW